jgi:F-type H+-transporting ATPase subunit a
MELSPDNIIIADLGIFRLNATIFYSWVVMAILIIGSWLVTRNITTDMKISRWQHMLETIVGTLRGQIRDVMQADPTPYLAFIGTLFLFISFSNFLVIFPGFQPPTGSLSTTVALALSVFAAVPVYGIMARGLGGYAKGYIEPTFIMLPFNIISEISRTLALAIRLFGNILSGQILVAIIVTIIPLFVPVLMQAFGIVVGQIQAYIFAVLATVYIASATRA